MFKKFDSESVSTVIQLKSSVQKAIRNKLLEQFPHLEEYIEQIIPKKEPLKLVRCADHIEILANGSGDYLFFRRYEEPYVPTLKLLHKYPFMCPLMKVDKGAIAFLIQGANVMCPGLTSKGAQMTPLIKEGSVVTLIAEGKQHALAVGYMKLSSEKIAQVNKGIGVENLHYLNDGLWRLKPVK